MRFPDKGYVDPANASTYINKYSVGDIMEYTCKCQTPGFLPPRVLIQPRKIRLTRFSL